MTSPTPTGPTHRPPHRGQGAGNARARSRGTRPRGPGNDAERFALAEANLREAHPIYLAAKDRGPTHIDTLACVQALFDLHTAWHAAKPGKDYDAKAAEWRAKLDAAQSPEP